MSRPDPRLTEMRQRLITLYCTIAGRDAAHPGTRDQAERLIDGMYEYFVARWNEEFAKLNDPNNRDGRHRIVLGEP